MKVEAFVGILVKYARIVDAHGDHDLAGQMEQLARAWSPAMAWSMKDLLGELHLVHLCREQTMSACGIFARHSCDCRTW